MSSSVLSVSNNYKIKVINGGNVTIDTGAGGQLILTGNLVVQGNTTTISTSNLNIKDNIILLNTGELGSGVSLGTAGIQVDRGPNPTPPGGYSRAQILWDESIQWADPVSATTKNGLWVFSTVTDGINGIRTNSINTDGGDLYLINDGAGVISVTGTNNYENNVTDDDHIPNKRYVDDAINGAIATGFLLNNPGEILYRGPVGAVPLSIGTQGQIMTVIGGYPTWQSNYNNGRINITNNNIIGQVALEDIIVTPGLGGGVQLQGNTVIGGNLETSNLSFNGSVISTLDSSSVFIDNTVVATSDAVLQGNVSVGGQLTASNGVIANLFTGVGSIASILAIAPSSSSSGGIKGQIAFDGTDLYICVDTNTWIKMSVITSF